MSAEGSPAPSPSRLHAVLWLVPAALLAAVAYVFVAALQAEPARPLRAPVTLGHTYPLTIEEPGGRKVVIPAKPVRIIPADAGTADILSALIEPSRFAAVPATVDSFGCARQFFAANANIPRYEHMQAETVLAFKPDLFVAVIFRDNAAVDLIEQRGVPVLKLAQFRTFAGIRASFVAIGSAVGEGEKVRALAEEFDKRLAAVEKAVVGLPKPRALWYSKYDQGYVVGTGESQDEVVRRAGATNAAAEMNLAGHVHFNFEQMLKLKPDWIVVSGDNGLDSPQAQIVLGEPTLAELPAIKERRIAVVPDRYASSISHFVANAVEILARQIHPEAFATPEARNPRPETR